MQHTMQHTSRLRTLIAAVAGIALVATACGDDGIAGSTPTEPTPAESSETTASTVATDTSEASESQPGGASAIVSLSPTATEMLYVIGAGDQVIGVDDFSNYPPETAEKMHGLSGYEPNVEAIAALEPDLVVTDGTNPDFLAQLDTLGIAHWEGPAAAGFDDIYDQIEQLGAATGHVGEAAELVGQMQADIDAAIAELPELAEPMTYYHELDASFFTATGDTFIGTVYAAAGLVNIADAVGDGNPYPQLSAEFIVTADPDLIFLACTKFCGESPDTVAARGGWGSLSAVANGNVIPMDDDVASRWGPRVVEYLEQVGAAVTAAASQNA